VVTGKEKGIGMENSKEYAGNQLGKGTAFKRMRTSAEEED